MVIGATHFSIYEIIHDLRSVLCNVKFQEFPTTQKKKKKQ